MVSVKINEKALRIKDCLSLSKGIKGLMFSKLKHTDGAILKCNNIHTAFCRPLDIAWLDSSLGIIRIEKTRPWRTYHCSSAVYVLELKQGLVKEFKNLEIEI